MALHRLPWAMCNLMDNSSVQLLAILLTAFSFACLISFRVSCLIYCHIENYDEFVRNSDQDSYYYLILFSNIISYRYWLMYAYNIIMTSYCADDINLLLFDIQLFLHRTLRGLLTEVSNWRTLMVHLLPTLNCSFLLYSDQLTYYSLLGSVDCGGTPNSDWETAGDNQQRVLTKYLISPP